MTFRRKRIHNEQAQNFSTTSKELLPNASSRDTRFSPLVGIGLRKQACKHTSNPKLLWNPGHYTQCFNCYLVHTSLSPVLICKQFKTIPKQIPRRSRKPNPSFLLFLVQTRKNFAAASRGRPLWFSREWFPIRITIWATVFQLQPNRDANKFVLLKLFCQASNAKLTQEITLAS